LFTINASVSLLSLLAVPDPEQAGAVITWNTDPGPENLAGYRLEKAVASGAWRNVVALTKETRVQDPEAGPATRYRLYSVNGLNEELFMGEIAFRPRAPLAAWPLPYRGGKLSISFATSGGLGGASGPADVGIFDVQGRLVRRLAQGSYTAGYQSAEWDGRNDRGRDVASGIYLIRALTGGSRTTVKLVVAR
ncbi:MAG TPA: FlgD immunoglobulin-like domain containing protein, partial [Candidatus Saccharimonadales bacterium]|nr:FlgD immunoglobulin-like domain containing protein [Candidatus Saccharimonadales bacterium]